MNYLFFKSSQLVQGFLNHAIFIYVFFLVYAFTCKHNFNISYLSKTKARDHGILRFPTEDPWMDIEWPTANGRCWVIKGLLCFCPKEITQPKRV